MQDKTNSWQENFGLAEIHSISQQTKLRILKTRLQNVEE